MHIAAIGQALPPNYYDQETLLAAFKAIWGGRFFNTARLEQLHRNVLVGGRHLALPIESYRALEGFGATNDAFIRCAADLGAVAIGGALDAAGLRPDDVDHLLFVSSSGIATPSVDALLVNRLELRSDVKRTPVFGLGCVAGAAGLVRAADFLRGAPRQVAVLLSVELCSLTLQAEDLSIANVISSGLFGDGAAAVVMVGAEHPLAREGRCAGPRLRASRAVFYPDTEYVMGWRIGERGFEVVLSADVPQIVERHLAADVDRFLAAHGLDRDEIASWVCHPGGPKVLTAMAEALELPREALELSWRSLAELGNLSSASALLILRQTMLRRAPPAGAPGMIVAMGPGFCAELILVEW